MSLGTGLPFSAHQHACLIHAGASLTFSAFMSASWLHGDRFASFRLALEQCAKAISRVAPQKVSLGSANTMQALSNLVVISLVGTVGYVAEIPSISVSDVNNTAEPREKTQSQLAVLRPLVQQRLLCSVFGRNYRKETHFKSWLPRILSSETEDVPLKAEGRL